jgi:hypothetical protein
MVREKLLPVCLALALLAPGAGLADPWKDESGQARRDGRPDREHREWSYLRDDRRGHVPPHHAPPSLVPPGHMPPPGECRLWFPGLPPGQQPPPHRC